MKDIFDAKILCEKCNKPMIRKIVDKPGAALRAMKCETCKSIIYHPTDLEKYKQFNSLKGKTYNVKLRVVGNSHAISIPKEIISFIQEQGKMMDDMVRLCFDDMKRITLRFGDRKRWKE
ncbi:hypothetical protein COU62_00430 [Candidatus Pacearchaeota archaeon CG10_big_fil_rev_8_21_14_0_10_35_219]|nr:hypothetical protein [Candidatus Pacearchaeota archaeon]OIO42718.1 MAG: hypothetical protein AUJ63_02295 [Candidatus Pacearchaeota archaeon CG1_02_35_32]PIO08256.1 MAG: hypothetical protein COU62_00430 [Candidatus Pacearchaeota archaeon CG10_big_fil_rev_8_21_14_0_10_35_219]PIY81857.1 MAG: hypothetical protein COY79_00170 [Candidatus Pacearchaeota archaeon CG_4_10_14_0_8_um_filter_35_169]PIZ79402.1 MAG: hypothetical protein COY00_04465 [Candidatus Pacearchaeota archaeon CG_4_10_14_0_2_um_filt